MKQNNPLIKEKLSQGLLTKEIERVFETRMVLSHDNAEVLMDLIYLFEKHLTLERGKTYREFRETLREYCQKYPDADWHDFIGLIAGLEAGLKYNAVAAPPSTQESTECKCYSYEDDKGMLHLIQCDHCGSKAKESGEK